MQVFIDNHVHVSIERFYEATLELHPALDEVTVMKKIERLYSALESLGMYPTIYAIARYKKSWQKKGVHEASHSLLLVNPEDRIDNDD